MLVRHAEQLVCRIYVESEVDDSPGRRRLPRATALCRRCLQPPVSIRKEY